MLCTSLVNHPIYQTPERVQIFHNAIPKGSVFCLFQSFISTKFPFFVFSNKGVLVLKVKGAEWQVVVAKKRAIESQGHILSWVSGHKPDLACVVKNRNESFLVYRHQLVKFFQPQGSVVVARRRFDHGLILEQADDAVGVIHPSTSWVTGGVSSVVGYSSCCTVMGCARGACTLLARGLTQHWSAISTITNEVGLQKVLKVTHVYVLQSTWCLGLGKAGELWDIIIHDWWVHTELRTLHGEGAACLRGGCASLRGCRLLGDCRWNVWEEFMQVWEVDGGVVLVDGRGCIRAGGGGGLSLDTWETGHWSGFGRGPQVQALHDSPRLVCSCSRWWGGGLHLGLDGEELTRLIERVRLGFCSTGNRGHYSRWRHNKPHKINEDDGETIN